MANTAAKTLETYQPFDPAELSSPHEGWALLRREAPVYRINLPHIPVPVYMLTRRQEIDYITRHPELFSNNPVPSVWRWGDFQEPEIAKMFADAGYRVAIALQTSDPPVSGQHRKFLDDALSRKGVAEFTPELNGLIDQLMKNIPSDQPVDFVDSYAVPLPLLVIMLLMGVPVGDYDFFRAYTDEFAFLLDPSSTTERAAEAAKTVLDGYRYFERDILRYRAKPANNLMSSIANARFDGDAFAAMDVALAITSNTVIAGNETTRNALSSAMYILTQRQDLWLRLKADRDLVPDFVEEVLRYAAPSNTTPRTVREDTQLAGIPISKGSCLFVLWGAGSLDEAVFDNPLEFNIDRRNKRDHSAFGLGARHCPGNLLARAEITFSVRRWLKEFEKVELAVPSSEIHYEPIFGFHALGHLPIRVTRI